MESIRMDDHQILLAILTILAVILGLVILILIMQVMGHTRIRRQERNTERKVNDLCVRLK